MGNWSKQLNYFATRRRSHLITQLAPCLWDFEITPASGIRGDTCIRSYPITQLRWLDAIIALGRTWSNLQQKNNLGWLRTYYSKAIKLFTKIRKHHTKWIFELSLGTESIHETDEFNVVYTIKQNILSVFLRNILAMDHLITESSKLFHMLLADEIRWASGGSVL